MPRPIPSKLIVATHNQSKLREFADLFRPLGIETVSSASLGIPSPKETGTTCVENAVLKARFVAKALKDQKFLILADDSGLFIHALQGKPGVHSADWINPDAKAAMQRVQHELGNLTDRTAYFLSVLVLCWPDGHTDIIEGRVHGTIAPEPRGSDGHGYDPIFIPKGDTRTFAEMGADEKNAISHRGVATKTLIKEFFSRPQPRDA